MTAVKANGAKKQTLTIIFNRLAILDKLHITISMEILSADLCMEVPEPLVEF